MVNFKLVRTYNQETDNYSTWEIIHIKSGQMVLSLLGDDQVELAISLADQYELNPALGDSVLRLNLKESNYA